MVFKLEGGGDWKSGGGAAEDEDESDSEDGRLHAGWLLGLDWGAIKGVVYQLTYCGKVVDQSLRPTCAVGWGAP